VSQAGRQHADFQRAVQRRGQHGQVQWLLQIARASQQPAQRRASVAAGNQVVALVEQAGGMATDGRRRILDIPPGKLHERVAVVLGSKNEVQRVTQYHLDDAS